MSKELHVHASNFQACVCSGVDNVDSLLSMAILPVSTSVSMLNLSAEVHDAFNKQLGSVVGPPVTTEHLGVVTVEVVNHFKETFNNCQGSLRRERIDPSYHGEGGVHVHDQDIVPQSMREGSIGIRNNNVARSIRLGEGLAGVCFHLVLGLGTGITVELVKGEVQKHSNLFPRQHAV